jgi:peroxiredoxin
MAPPKPQEIGDIMEDFRLPDVQGNQQSLSSYLSGKKGAVVLFWSSVCAHCVHYDGYLNGFTERHPQLGLVVVGARSGETLEQARTTVEKRRLAFPLLFDADGKLAKRWFTQQTPRAFLLDNERTLLYRGAIDNFKFPGDPHHVDYLEAAIAEFLNGQHISRKETASFGCAIRAVYYDIPVRL